LAGACTKLGPSTQSTKMRLWAGSRTASARRRDGGLSDKRQALARRQLGALAPPTLVSLSALRAVDLCPPGVDHEGGCGRPPIPRNVDPVFSCCRRATAPRRAKCRQSGWRDQARVAARQGRGSAYEGTRRSPLRQTQRRVLESASPDDEYTPREPMWVLARQSHLDRRTR
jgi:hypothetical protein